MDYFLMDCVNIIDQVYNKYENVMSEENRALGCGGWEKNRWNKWLDLENGVIKIYKNNR
jgi:hypothetical protein